MDRRGRGVAAALTLLTVIACSAKRAQQAPETTPETKTFTSLKAPVIVLTHARVIDGTGRPARDDQTLVVTAGRIAAVGKSGAVEIPKGARIRDLTGKTVLPGLVGMHEPLFYQIEREGSSPLVTAAPEAFAKLYLAAGVTTIRTAATADFDADVHVKQLIETGGQPGPDVDVTAQSLNGIGERPSPDKVTEAVESAADRGATSFNAYTTLRSAELNAAIAAAHKRSLRITGHLCAVGYREAAALGIDNIEGGIIFDADLYSKKQPDVCPPQDELFADVMRRGVADATIARTIGELVRHGVAITSTLAVIESYTGREHSVDPAIPDLLASRLRGPYQAGLKRWSNPKADDARAWAELLRLEMAFERAFAAAGGRLMAGGDPAGWGGTIAGSGDQRELELLVEAGLRPEAAIKVATSNGATFLHKHEIGTIDSGQQADLLVVRGNPLARISDVRNIDVVMKEGVGYDPETLRASVAGSIGEYDIRLLLRWPANAIVALLFLILAMRIGRMKGRRPRNQYGDPWNIKGIPKHERKAS